MFSFFRPRSTPPDDDMEITLTLDWNETAQTERSDISEAALAYAVAAQARQKKAETDIREDEILYGLTFSVEVRRLRVARRVSELENLDALVEGSIRLYRLELEVAQRDRRFVADRHRELVNTVERGNIAAKALDFAKAHPFLTGFIGAGVVNNIRKRPR